MSGITHMAALGAALASPARAQILCVLMEGRAYTNKELASHAGITAQTATVHLQHLQGAGLTSSLRSGRCIYHRIASEQVAQFLESAALLAPDPILSTRASKHLRSARSCYSHLAGHLGVSVADALRADGRVVGQDEHWKLSESGKAWAQEIGLAPKPLKPCLDWTERRAHLAGPFANALMSWMFDQGIITRHGSGRGLILQDTAKLKAAGITVESV
jgi:DNA-binding transcriptional ArsR family regulator